VVSPQPFVAVAWVRSQLICVNCGGQGGNGGGFFQALRFPLTMSLINKLKNRRNAYGFQAIYLLLYTERLALLK
jgi:hypothetical protein